MLAFELLKEEHGMARKLLSKSMSLAGQTETITAMDFRKAPGDVLLQCQMGKVFSTSLRTALSLPCCLRLN
jgi:hypothetical protein